jgi:hypothetical protein
MAAPEDKKAELKERYAFVATPDAPEMVAPIS